MYDVTKHILHQDGAAVPFVASPNGSNTVRPLYLIIHYTAGTTANGAIAWLKNPQAKASAHLVLDRDGSVTQMRPFNRSAWHAGKSAWRDLEGMNAFSLGIEIVNAGKLSHTEGGAWLTWAKHPIPADQVIIAKHRDETEPDGTFIRPSRSRRSSGSARPCMPCTGSSTCSGTRTSRRTARSILAPHFR